MDGGTMEVGTQGVTKTGELGDREVALGMIPDIIDGYAGSFQHVLQNLQDFEGVVKLTQPIDQLIISAVERANDVLKGDGLHINITGDSIVLSNLNENEGEEENKSIEADIEEEILSPFKNGTNLDALFKFMSEKEGKEIKAEDAILGGISDAGTGLSKLKLELEKERHKGKFGTLERVRRGVYIYSRPTE